MAEQLSGPQAPEPIPRRWCFKSDDFNGECTDKDCGTVDCMWRRRVGLGRSPTAGRDGLHIDNSANFKRGV